MRPDGSNRAETGGVDRGLIERVSRGGIAARGGAGRVQRQRILLAWVTLAMVGVVTAESHDLVVGGGGVTGVGWELGLLCGLAAAGVAVDAADVAAGTSAGSVVGLLCSGVPLDELHERQLAPPAVRPPMTRMPPPRSPSARQPGP
jgi:hypothetical protein